MSTTYIVLYALRASLRCTFSVLPRTGFSSAPRTWLAVNADYVTVNLAAQQAAERSHYLVYRRLAELRQHPAFARGSFEPVAISKYVLAYTR